MIRLKKVNSAQKKRSRVLCPEFLCKMVHQSLFFNRSRIASDTLGRWSHGCTWRWHSYLKTYPLLGHSEDFDLLWSYFGDVLWDCFCAVHSHDRTSLKRARVCQGRGPASTDTWYVATRVRFQPWRPLHKCAFAAKKANKIGLPRKGTKPKQTVISLFYKATNGMDMRGWLSIPLSAPWRGLMRKGLEVENRQEHEEGGPWGEIQPSHQRTSSTSKNSPRESFLLLPSLSSTLWYLACCPTTMSPVLLSFKGLENMKGVSPNSASFRINSLKKRYSFKG